MGANQKWALTFFGLLLIFRTVSPTTATAQERQQVTGRDWSASLGASVWLSKGESEWEHRTPIGGGLFLGSKLHWRDIEAPIYGVEGDFLWKRLVLTAGAGWGSVEDGTLIDDDFVTITGPLLSRTRSTVDDGNVYYGNFAVGWRAVEWRDFEGRQGFLDLLVGYQWWREKYEAFGVVTLADSPFLPGGEAPSSIKVITHEWTWQSPRIGGRAYIPFPAGFGARIGAFFLPWSSLRVEDTHHLRTNGPTALQQNPSVVTEATGGFGYQVEGAITFTLWKGLGIEAGYRRWEINLDKGDVKFRAVSVSTPKDQLIEASIKRGGFFAGLYYRF